MKRNRHLMSLYLIAFVLLLISSCKKDDPNTKIEDINVVDVSKGTDFDYWIVAKDGSNFFVEMENDKPVTAYFTPDVNKEGYPIYFDSCGFPEKAVIDGYTFIFRNFDSTKVDIAVIYPDGTINIARQIELGQNLSLMNLNSETNVDWLEWIGNAIGAVACGIEAVTLPENFGLSAISTLTGCGATVIANTTEFLPEEYDILAISSSEAEAIAAVVGCTSSGGESCIVDIASTEFNSITIELEHLEEIDADVHISSSALEYGYGDIQITLSWNNIADLDLHVFDPAGEEIYWDSPKSTSGGQLDIDDINGFGPENIYWEKGKAPSGTYEVYIHHYPWSLASYKLVTGNSEYPTTSSYTLLINAFGRVTKYTGYISFDNNIHIASFDQDGLKSATLTSTRTISTPEKPIK